MKILLFGTGDYYRKYRDWLRKEDILGLIDNDENKRGTLIDGYTVYLPREAAELPYDCIVVLSVHEETMHRQLKELGVPDSKIYKFSELYKHPELIVAERAVSFWGSDKVFSDIMEVCREDAVLLMSHNLDFNGASLALFYLAQILVKNEFYIVFASWSDGALRQHLYKEDIPVIIDPNLQMKTQREVQWTHGFHRIICNTMNYYQFLSDRSTQDKIVWWLHDPPMFYKSLNQELLYKIKEENLNVYAVGSIAEEAFKAYFPNFKVRRLLYGIPEVVPNKIPYKKLMLIIIGNVQEYKGQKILIQALKLLDRAVTEQIHVRIVGFQPSTYANEVKKLAEELGGMVEMIPPADRESIHRMLDESDVLLCPSVMDTMPVVVNEGMQHCLPCIVSDGTGIAAYIKDGENGFVVRRKDAEALAEKVRWCVEHRDRLEQIGKNGRHIYEQYFSMDVFEKNLMKIIHTFM